MSYRLTLKAFKQEQEDQNKAIQALNDRVQKLESKANKSWWSWLVSFPQWCVSKGL